jgi:cytochrome c553
LLPALALAAVSAREEFRAATRAKPDSVRGAKLFAQCAQCHGADGGGTEDGARPRIAGQHFRVIVKQLVDFRAGLHWDVQMEDAASRHRLGGTQDIADVAAYVSSLPMTRSNEQGSGEEPALGEAIYNAQCVRCHGTRAEGSDAKGVPRLGGQHYGYLLRQMYDSVDGRRPNLSPTHRGEIGPLSFEEVKALADYLSRFTPHATQPR